MNIALICPEAPGHLNPMGTLGGELARRGHRISLLANPLARPKADACGFQLLPVGESEHHSGEWKAGLRKLARLKGLAALRQTGRLLRDGAAILLRDGPECLRSAGVEAVVVDHVSPAGAALAEALRLPYVTVCNGLAMHQEPGVPPSVLGWRYRPGLLGRTRNRFGNRVAKMAAWPVSHTVSVFRRRHGLPRFRFDDIRTNGLAQIAQQPEFFDFPRAELPPHFHYTGPWHGPNEDCQPVPFPWEKLDGRPLVYASLGTLQNGLQDVFRAILDGCADLPLQVVLSLGNKDVTLDFPVPPNAIVVPFAPQLMLLERCRLLITHAGFNTVLDGLSRGVPMLCLPITNDQPGLARRVEWLGAGEVLKPGQATGASVRALVEKLLAGNYTEAARKCRNRFRNCPGVVRAADIVEAALRTGKRVDRRTSCAVLPEENPMIETAVQSAG